MVFEAAAGRLSAGESLSAQLSVVSNVKEGEMLYGKNHITFDNFVSLFASFEHDAIRWREARRTRAKAESSAALLRREARRTRRRRRALQDATMK
jgi:hypothetical protein